ncbi:GlxA family transcriptional regulator [Jannaschia helgolandensis]|uniref:GlxA family transcriptional regulator n=1 Tax=Jannaschia helgolandensis TaxID=188906 RepID=UPI0030D82D98|tara:strand:+ start:14272 stop:15285 length:1014 start_codon:yes stop_codon:yes gene_type:complete
MQNNSHPQFDVILLAYPGIGPAILYGYYDVFASAGSLWPQLISGTPGKPLFDVRIAARSGTAFRIFDGIPVEPHVALAQVERTDLILISEVEVDPDVSPTGMLAEEAAWLRQQYEAGATIGASCSGSLLLAEAGLLRGEEATVHWALAEFMRIHYPETLVRSERVLCVAGEDGRLVTAGGHAGWHDLALHMIARFCGLEEATRAAKSFLLSPHPNGQGPYAAMLKRNPVSDPVIMNCQFWLADNYSVANPVAEMIARSGLPSRTFSRRFGRATGYQPLDYVQSLRIEEAKQLLETSTTSIEEIGIEVGYDDPSYFRRLFKRKVGVSPRHYRTFYASK